MRDALEMWKKFRLSEAYEVVKTAVVVIGRRTYRIEVLRSYWNPKVPFTTRAWVEETVILTPKDSKGAKPEDRQLWVRYDLPGADEGDPDSALTQALDRLAEQTKRVSQP